MKVGADRVDAYIVRRQFDRHRFGQPFSANLLAQ
jgi:hypothetical protein